MNKKQFIEGCQKRNLSITKAEEVYKRFKAIEPYFCMSDIVWGFLTGETDPDYAPDDFEYLNDDNIWEMWGEFRFGEVCYKKGRNCLMVLHYYSNAFLRIHTDFIPDLLYDRNPETDKNPKTAFYGAPIARILSEPLENIGDKFLTPYKPDGKEIAQFKDNLCRRCFRCEYGKNEKSCNILVKTTRHGTWAHEWVYDVFNFPVCLGYQNSNL